MNCCIYVIETSVSIKGGRFLVQMRKCLLHKKNSVSWH